MQIWHSVIADQLLFDTANSPFTLMLFQVEKIPTTGVKKSASGVQAAVRNLRVM